MAKGCLQEIPDRHRRQAVLRLPCLEANQILLSHLDFGSVLDQQNSFVLRDELSDEVQECRLATPGSSSNEDVFARQHIILKLVSKPSFQGSDLDEVLDAKVPSVQLTNGQRHTVQTTGRNDGGDTVPIRQS